MKINIVICALFILISCTNKQEEKKKIITDLERIVSYFGEDKKFKEIVVNQSYTKVIIYDYNQSKKFRELSFKDNKWIEIAVINTELNGNVSISDFLFTNNRKTLKKVKNKIDSLKNENEEVLIKGINIYKSDYFNKNNNTNIRIMYEIDKKSKDLEFRLD